MDKYDDVAIKIVDAIKSDYSDSSDSHKFDEELVKKITDILIDNFNIKYEDMGIYLLKDVNMFDPDSGYEFGAPLFTTPSFISIGAMIIGPETFPNYNIDNKYIGYTDKGIFHQINDFTLFMRHMRKRPLTVVALFVLIYLVVSLAFFAIK